MDTKREQLMSSGENISTYSPDNSITADGFHAKMRINTIND